MTNPASCRSRELHPQARTRRLALIAICAVAGLLAACSPRENGAAPSWDPRAAAGYLDHRMDWWMQWPTAARDHGTFCISCHTALTYSLSRSSLRRVLGESGPSREERRLVENVAKRVRLWAQIRPYYENTIHSNSRSPQSRGTEAILNAVILARTESGDDRLNPDGQAAFDNLWKIQEQTGDAAGGWQWIDFGLAPWEFADAQYYGATLAALAVGCAPDHYQANTSIQDGLTRLKDYLQRKRPGQSAHNLAYLLWASTKLDGLLNAHEQQAIIDTILLKQNGDGGWSLNTLAPRLRHGGSMLAPKSDGYATGLVTFVLQEAGVSATDVRLQRGLSWLRRNQREPQGYWHASSPNKRRAPYSNSSRFMSDAATAFAVLSLTEASNRAPSPPNGPAATP